MAPDPPTTPPVPTPAQGPVLGLGIKEGVSVTDEPEDTIPKGNPYLTPGTDTKNRRRGGDHRGRGRGSRGDRLNRANSRSSSGTLPTRQQPRLNQYDAKRPNALVHSNSNTRPSSSHDRSSNHGQAVPPSSDRGQAVPSASNSNKNSQQSQDVNGSGHEVSDRRQSSSSGVSQHNLNASGMGMRPEWADWQSICLSVKGIPPKATTFDLWSLFQHHGQIVFVELFERNGVRTGSGRVRFSPPPAKQFWNDYMTVTIQGRQVKIAVNLQRDRSLPQVQAPSGRNYPPSLNLAMKALEFGVLSRENEIMPLRTIKNDAQNGFFLTADFKFKCLEITFACDMKDPRRDDPSIRHPSPVGELEHTQQYRMTIPFPHLKKLVFIDIDEDTWALLIALPSPPLFYKQVDDAKSHSKNRNTWNKRDSWNRTVDITYDTSWFKNDPVELHKPNQFVDIGRWTSYRLFFAKSALNDWDAMKIALKDFNISVDNTTLKEFPEVPAKTPRVWDILEPQKTSAFGSNDNLTLLANTEDVHLPYDVRYQLEVCISQGILSEFDITAEFLQRLAAISNTRTNRRDRAKDLLAYISEPPIGTRVEDREKLDEKRIYDPMSLFEDKKAMSHYPELSLPDHCQWVRKVVVTPTTMYLSSPAPEPSNRVLRQYNKHEDRFLRVQFTDEIKKGRIFPAPDSDQENALFNRVHRTLQNGIQIGGRHFQYLATGNSQFRENGAYFFCPTEFLTCDNIRRWMGDVNHIRVVAKYAARLGQCFSTTKEPKTCPIGQTIVPIKDIEHNGWCFTDGVGKIAPSRADFLAQTLGSEYKTLKSIPSVFQFRLGGSKGILVQWPDIPFNEVHLRPSQNKFTSSTKGLEVIKASRYSTATLNRQTILILSCLGVPDAVFEDMLKNQVANYERAMEEPRVAMQLLSKFIDENGITTSIAQAVADGFMDTKEPFVMAILQNWRAWSMRLLREKARIVVEQSAFVFGCVDETRTLRGWYQSTESTESEEKKNDPNSLPQIFLQVPKTATRLGQQAEYRVITGICVVGRNPALHPGDVRVVEAVDLPALRHLRDVVVFPGVGDRDIPSMCSGGDLDGDDFFVIWDPQLIPTEWYFPPMVHEAPKSKELNRDVRVTDLISFFVRYMKNDSLSTIAHAHLAKCDALLDGPKDPKCIELAHLHSNSVDYPKTGLEAKLEPSLRPRLFPHFMEKPPHKTYHSRKILGRLYDHVAKTKFDLKLGGTFDERILRRYALDADTLKMARLVKRQHDKAMRQIMNQHDIETEFEVWSTFILSRPRVGSEYKRQEKMEPVVTSHKERFRKACIKVAGSRDPRVLYPVVAACYHVTWEEAQAALAQTDKTDQGPTATEEQLPFISFPWIFERELGRIAMSKDGFALEELPKPTKPSDDGYENDEEEFERLLSTGVIDGNEVINGEGYPSGVPTLGTTIGTTEAAEGEVVMDEEVVELDENEGEDTGLDALARLGV
ncbi:RdRP-domain-containing protein [Hypoxylon rubiginosum]|uniref:RdRP-domain-containing protein n=1 Tax=Hypoxylon rubiginosum TaxID=110542 RepID=A0ACC0DA88_9PEZI|nr:RdRP-domain-containing protein [Hypoxylon rubiginosum]